MLARLNGTAFFGTGDLKRKIVAAAGWSTLAFIAQTAMRLGSTVVLTRLLAPEVFGIFAVILSVNYVAVMLSDFGIRSLILTREHEIDDAFLRSCWTVQVLRGLALGLVVTLVGLGLAGLQELGIFAPDTSYADPVLPWAVAAMSLTLVLQGLESPVKFVHEKRMHFRRVTWTALVVQLFGMIVTITLAFALENVWAVVIGGLATAATSLAVSHLAFGGPAMRPLWRRDHVRVLFQRGRWLVSHSAMTAAINVADRILLGLFLPAGAFGMYFIGRQIVDLVIGFLERTHASMGLQVFTDLRRRPDPRDLVRNYYRYRFAFDAVAMLACGMLLTLAPLLVGIVYPDAYRPVAGVIQILALGLPLVGPGLLRDAFGAQRRFRLMAVLSFVRMATIWTGLVVAIFVFRSETLALLVVALHRVPEVALLTALGRREGIIDLFRELRLVPLVAVGAAAGLILEWLWLHAVV